jgi:DNA-binding NtrC family response regulator
MKEHILIADDDPDVLSALRYLFRTEGYLVDCVRSPQAALDFLKEGDADLLLMDLNYMQDTTSGKEGFELIRKVRELHARLPIVVMTAWGSIDIAVQAMQRGAGDFIQKPWDNARLLSIVRNQSQRYQAEQRSRRLEEENQLLRQQLGVDSPGLIAISPRMTAFLQQVAQVAASDASILLTGENGTGKSLIARHIHELSPRRGQAFISVNMGSITETLFESEMFGHVKGAFTDARDDRIGRFELADKGTLFLDEIANTPVSRQAKLLRVLEEHHFEKVGSSRTQHSACRLVCATNANLEEAVQTGDFRRDLLFRINTITLRVPSLRERVEDIKPLAEFFLRTFAHKYNSNGVAFSPAAEERLLTYGWPGNVRELAHVVERAIILCRETHIQGADLGLARPDEDSSASKWIAAESTLDDIEKTVLSSRMQRYQGNGVAAAKSLGMSKSAFYRRLEKYKLQD